MNNDLLAICKFVTGLDLEDIMEEVTADTEEDTAYFQERNIRKLSEHIKNEQIRNCLS